MAGTLQDLIAASQGGQGPQGIPQAPQGGGQAPDIVAQLKALLTGGAAGPMPGQQNMGAYLNANQPPPGNPMLEAMAKMGVPPNPNMPPQGNIASMGVGPGPVTDQGLTDMLNASDDMRKDLPPAKRDGYTGADSQEQLDEGAPKRDDIGRQVGPGDTGRLQNDNNQGGYGSRDTVRGQLDKEQGVGGNKPMSTEQELDMVSKKMGSGDPSANGDFPTAKEIKALTSGEIDPKEFDAKWGKGAAKEMMDNADGEQSDDDGDHEYR